MNFTLFQYALDDEVLTKKAHPCGSKLWKVFHVGQDIGMQCQGCNHHVEIKRKNLEKATVEVRRINEQKQVEIIR